MPGSGSVGPRRFRMLIELEGVAARTRRTPGSAAHRDRRGRAVGRQPDARCAITDTGPGHRRARPRHAADDHRTTAGCATASTPTSGSWPMSSGRAGCGSATRSRSTMADRSQLATAEPSQDDHPERGGDGDGRRDAERGGHAGPHDDGRHVVPETAPMMKPPMTRGHRGDRRADGERETSDRGIDPRAEGRRSEAGSEQGHARETDERDHRGRDPVPTLGDSRCSVIPEQHHRGADRRAGRAARQEAPRRISADRGQATTGGVGTPVRGPGVVGAHRASLARGSRRLGRGTSGRPVSAAPRPLR